RLHLGAFIPEISPKVRGMPTMHTEAACASGALSVLLGAQWIMGGLYDAVLVVGAEQQKTMSSLDGSDVLGAAADYHNEKPEYGDFMFPKLFGKIAQIYIDNYGVSPNALAQVAYKNYAHARLNPLAQMREADLTYDYASQVSEKNPSVAPPLKVTDCSQITEIVAYEILGLAEPGKGAELAMSGATALPQVRGEHISGKIDFEIPVNTGGGLIGDGHPVGATGVRQVFEAYQQLTEQA